MRKKFRKFIQYSYWTILLSNAASTIMFYQPNLRLKKRNPILHCSRFYTQKLIFVIYPINIEFTLQMCRCDGTIAVSETLKKAKIVIWDSRSAIISSQAVRCWHTIIVYFVDHVLEFALSGILAQTAHDRSQLHCCYTSVTIFVKKVEGLSEL